MTNLPALDRFGWSLVWANVLSLAFNVIGFVGTGSMWNFSILYLNAIAALVLAGGRRHVY